MEKLFTPYALFVFIDNLANKDLEIKARKYPPPQRVTGSVGVI